MRKFATAVAAEVAPCLPEEFLAAYVIRVGVVKAGLHILGSWLDETARDWLPLDWDGPTQPT